jgi:hypothetical protein
MVEEFFIKTYNNSMDTIDFKSSLMYCYIHLIYFQFLFILLYLYFVLFYIFYADEMKL